ncbi:MAG: hypothetical protein GXP42_15930 [Chloroflexi bacterium]|nr:hypothetical protein [Chloroflexota bacterium]
MTRRHLRPWRTRRFYYGKTLVFMVALLALSFVIRARAFSYFYAPDRTAAQVESLSTPRAQTHFQPEAQNRAHFFPFIQNQRFVQPQLAPSPLDAVHSVAESEFTLDIVVRDVVDLSDFRFTLHYDPGLLQALDVEAGPMLTETGRSIAIIGPSIDNAKGVLEFGALSSGDAAGASGRGVLAIIHFRPLKAGVASLSWSKVRLTNTHGSLIPASGLEGSVTLQKAPITPSPSPTITPSPTFTPTPTSTSMPTFTPTPTITPSPTLTPTPLPGTTLFAQPISATHSLAGGDFVLDIAVENVSDLGAYQFTLHFEPTIVEAQSAYLGPFLATTGRQVVFLPFTIDNAQGVITVGAFTYGDAQGASGSGTLASIKFRPVRIGTTPLTWSDDVLTSTQPHSIPHESFSGEITIAP